MKELEQVQAEIKEQSARINKIVDAIVAEYAEELDEFITIIKSVLDRVKSGELDEYPDGALELQVIKLPMLMYFTGKGLETLGGESDIAKAIKDDIYGRIMIQAVGTIPEKEAKAGQGSVNEKLMETVYSRAYKKLKIQIDMADKLFSALKKVLSKRILEIELGKREAGRMGGEYDG